MEFTISGEIYEICFLEDGAVQITDGTYDSFAKYTINGNVITFYEGALGPVLTGIRVNKQPAVYTSLQFPCYPRQMSGKAIVLLHGAEIENVRFNSSTPGLYGYLSNGSLLIPDDLTVYATYSVDGSRLLLSSNAEAGPEFISISLQ